MSAMRSGVIDAVSVEDGGRSAGHLKDEGSACVWIYRLAAVVFASSLGGKPATMEACALARAEDRATGEAHERAGSSLGLLTEHCGPEPRAAARASSALTWA